METQEKDWFMWVGVACMDCNNGYEHSPSNYVSVDKFDYCPGCGSSNVEWREVRLPLGGEIDVYLEDE